MNRVIILEGPDGAGKTTVAETLRRYHGFKVKHTGVPNPRWNSQDLFRQYVSTLELALRSDQPVVFDRLYLGEVIYGPIFRGKSLLNAVQLTLIERLVRARDVKLVFCLPTWDVVLENWQRKKQDYVTSPDKLQHVYHRYEEEADRWGTGGLHRYDYNDLEFAPTARQFDNFFRPEPALPCHVVGSPRAKLLLVGEQVNLRLTGTDWAFFADTGSSGYLNEALSRGGVPEEDLALMNAIGPKGYDHEFQPVLERLPYVKKVVALGKKAESRLRSQQINHCCLPHPAFVKRFKNGTQKEYAQQLREVYELCR